MKTQAFYDQLRCAIQRGDNCEEFFGSMTDDELHELELQADEADEESVLLATEVELDRRIALLLNR